MSTSDTTPTRSEPVPTDVYELAALLAKGENWSPLYTALAAQEGVEQAQTLLDEAGRLAEHEGEIGAQEQALADGIAEARHAISRAQTAVAALTSGSAWHVEYAEGTAGSDIAAFLTDAGRALRAADALMPAAE